MFIWAWHLDGGPKRVHHATVTVHHASVTAGDRVYSFGGWSEKTLDSYAQMDVHVFNTVSMRWVKLPPVTNGRGKRPLEVPSVLHGHTAVLVEDTVYVWGGVPYSNVLYAFDVDAHRWFKPRASGTVPEGRDNHSACVLGKVMFMYGGWNLLTYYADDVYKLDTSTTAWSLIDTRGAPALGSSHHSATVIGTKMFVFGGRPHLDNDVRVFDTDTERWLSVRSSAWPRPEGRSGHSAFAYGGELYAFGGNDRERTFSDLWTFSPQTSSWRKVETKGKGPRLTTLMGCCTVGDRTVLFGGLRYKHVRGGRYVPDAPADDLYVLDLRPSLKTLCKLWVIQYGLELSGLPHNVSWELAAMMK